MTRQEVLKHSHLRPPTRRQSNLKDLIREEEIQKHLIDSVVTSKTFLVTQYLLIKLKLLQVIGSLAECSGCGRMDKRLYCATQSLTPATVRLDKDTPPLCESLRALRIAVQGSGKADSRRSA